jgi:pimeloyl-ACP methyl ester carboxylesterase
MATEKLMLNMPANKLGRYYVALKLFFPSTERMPMGIALAFDRFRPKYYTEIQLESVITQQRALVMHWVHDDATAMRIAQLQLPVLILNGMKDGIIPPVNSIILASIIPNAQLLRWQNGGHAMIYQYPDDIAEAISRFYT